MCLSPMTSSCGASDTLSLQPQHKASSQCRGWDRRLLQGKLRTGTCLSLACCIPTVDTTLFRGWDFWEERVARWAPSSSSIGLALTWAADVSSALNYLILHLPGVDSQVGHAEIEISITFSLSLLSPHAWIYEYMPASSNHVSPKLQVCPTCSTQALHPAYSYNVEPPPIIALFSLLVSVMTTTCPRA